MTSYKLDVAASQGWAGETRWCSSTRSLVTRCRYIWVVLMSACPRIRCKWTMLPLFRRYCVAKSVSSPRYADSTEDSSISPLHAGTS